MATEAHGITRKSTSVTSKQLVFSCRSGLARERSVHYQPLRGQARSYRQIRGQKKKRGHSGFSHFINNHDIASSPDLPPWRSMKKTRMSPFPFR
jgi:hypothetical protein